MENRRLLSVSPSQPPVVDAGPDQTVRAASIVVLDGTVSDDCPATPLASQWTLLSGPGDAAFVDAAAVDTGVAFSLPGTYVLQLSVSDGEHNISDELTIVADSQGSLLHGVWISAYELMQLPTSGAGWDAVVDKADRETGPPNLYDMSDNADVYTLAKAFVGVRTGNVEYIDQVRSNVMASLGTELNGPQVALSRGVAPYLISADLVGLSPAQDTVYREWLDRKLRTDLHTGHTMQSYHETRSNNHGTMAGASRAAIAVYLGDTQEIDRVGQVLRGWTGDRSSYAGFQYGVDLSWQADPDAPVGINPVGATINGRDVDGVLPDEMRRGDSFQWPPVYTGYPWEALQGIIVASEILYRAGHNPYDWSDQAILRAVQWLHRTDGFFAQGDDVWTPWVIDARYGTSFATNPAGSPGKIMGYTSWTHQASAVSRTIDNFVPTIGSVGTELTITGSGLLTTTDVAFNGVSSTSFQVDSDNQLRATVPVGATTGPILITNAEGTSVSQSDFVVISAPSISSFAPIEGPPGTEITLTGSDLLGVTNVQLNGLDTSFTADSEIQIRLQVPVDATTGPIVVSNSVGSSTSADVFTVTESLPELTFFPSEDAHVKSSNLTTNYGGEDYLRLRGGSPEYRGLLKFNVLGLADSVESAILRLHVQDDSDDGGTVYQVSNDLISGVAPWTQSTVTWENAPSNIGLPLDVAGPAALGEWIELDVTSVVNTNGTYSFSLSSGSTNSVYFGSSESNNPPELVVSVVPANSPRATSMSPSQGPVGTEVTIVGYNLSQVTGVRIGSVDAPFTIDSDLQIRLAIPEDGASDTISLLYAGGAEPAGSFQVIVAPEILGVSPSQAEIGDTVSIAGSGFTGATTVTFGGASATFTMLSDGAVDAIVPVDAVTGPVEITNAAGSFATSTSFNVLRPPRVDAFSPSMGTTGTTVTVTGANFTNATAVEFNGVISPAWQVDSEDQITVQVPENATSGPIRVVGVDGSSTSETPFTVLTAPIINSFLPNSGPVGIEVTLFGSGLSDVQSVQLGGVFATDFAIDSETQLRFVVPAGASTSTIQVMNSSGTATSVDEFTVTMPPVATTHYPIDDAHVKSTSATTNYGQADHVRLRDGTTMYNGFFKFDLHGLGGPAQQATLRLWVTDASNQGGSVYLVSNDHLDSTTPWNESSLVWNNAPEITGVALDSIASVSQGSWVEFDVTAAITGSGIYSLALTSTSSNSVFYSSSEGLNAPELVIEAPPNTAPQITAFSPNSGPSGTEVTLSGSNFLAASAVEFAGIQANTYYIDSDAQIRVVVPLTATTGPIRVTSSEGSGISTQPFVVLTPPVIETMQPASGYVGQEVTILGHGFSGLSGIRFGIIESQFVIDSDTQVRATIPAGATTAPITLLHALGNAISTVDFVVTAAPTEFTVLAVDDAQVNSQWTDRSYGSRTTLRLRDSATEYRSYVKFEVNGLAGPASRARLRLYVTDASNHGGSIYLTSNDYIDGSAPWSQSQLTYDNAPAIVGSPLDVAGAVSTGTWVEFDVTSAVVGNGVFSFALIGGSSNSVYYSSMEGSHPPELVLEQ